MTYKIFQKIVKEKVKEYLPLWCQSKEIIIENVEQDQYLCIGTDDPMRFSLSNLYENYNKVKDMDAILSCISEVVCQVQNNQNLTEELELTPETVKDQIFPCIVEDTDCEYSRDFLDQKISYMIGACINENVFSVEVPDNVFKDLGFTKEQIHEFAMNNMKKYTPSHMKFTSFMELSKEEEKDWLNNDWDELNDMYITNLSNCIFGNCVLLDNDFLKKMKETLKDDYYIGIISSDSCLVVPKSKISEEDFVYDIFILRVEFEDEREFGIYTYDGELKEIEMDEYYEDDEDENEDTEDIKDDSDSIDN